MASNLKEKYIKVVAPKLAADFGVKNILAVPRLQKVVLNVGIPASNKDPKIQETVASVLSRISGQKPVPTLAKQSISNFKIRKGMVVGYMVTLRGSKMYDFVDKLINVTLPRVRDFRGISESNVDNNGNISMGFREYIAFPEIKSDEVERVHGLQVTITTSIKDHDKGLALFRELGLPFSKK